MQWQLQSDIQPKTLEELTEILLRNRGISDEKNFFNPQHPEKLAIDALGFDLAQVAEAVKIITKACTEKKDILIFGDYDADGICATAVLWEALKNLGCVARPFIPHREKHGYGLTIAALQEIIDAKKPDLIITVDNGIVAHPAAKFTQEQGVELVISDHHQPEVDAAGNYLYPPAKAIFHTTQLCGTTVAWMLGRELGAKNSSTSLDLCGLATISDQVPLKGANRSFAFYGIQALRVSNRLGLLALFEESGAKQKELDSYSVGFTLAPRINAMGRLSHGMDALRLLCTNNSERAAQLAGTLGETNIQRQDITLDQFNEAMAQVSVQSEESIIIAHSPNFHEGVIGLIAGRLMEKHSKPALVMSISEKGIKGSARSMKGVNITELLRSVREELNEVGGHPMAGGFSLSHEKLEVFKTKIFTMAKQTIQKELLIPTLILECPLAAEHISESTCLAIEKFAPFGSENPKPMFAFKELRVMSKQTMGKDNQHLKLVLEPVDFSADPFEALWWRKGELGPQYPVGSIVECSGFMECSSWKGRKKMQIIVKDIILDSAVVL